jgi:hypothetical protein
MNRDGHGWICVALLAGSALVGAASYFVAFGCRSINSDNTLGYVIALSRARVLLKFESFSSRPRRPEPSEFTFEGGAPFDFSDHLPKQALRCAGFAAFLRTSPGARKYTLILPLCALAVISLPLPLLRFNQGRRSRRRRQRGQCEYCGYELRTASRRCPECGRFRPWLPLVNRKQVKFYR